MTLDLTQQLSAADWLCCQWSLLDFQNSSLALGAESTRSVTSAEFVSHFIKDDAASKAAALQQRQHGGGGSVGGGNESHAVCPADNPQLLAVILTRCYASLEEAMPLTRLRFQPSPVLAAAGLALLVAGVAANALIGCVVVLVAAMRTKKNAFMLNLAAADVLVLLVCAPYSARLILVYDWRWDGLLCKLVPFIQGGLMSVSIWSQASVALYRYVVVCHPIRARSAFTVRRIAAWICCVWVFSVALCSPNLVSHRHRTDQVMGIFLLRLCNEDGDRALKRGYTVTLLVCLYLLPAVLMGVFCGLSIRALRRSLKFLALSSQQAHRQERRLQTSRMLLALLAAFVACWGPYHGLTLWLHTVQDKSDDRQAKERLYLAQFATLVLGYSNSAVNPVCLIGISSEFRRHCLQFLGLRCCREAGGGNRQLRAAASVSMRSLEQRPNHLRGIKQQGLRRERTLSRLEEEGPDGLKG